MYDQISMQLSHKGVTKKKNQFVEKKMEQLENKVCI
jgi:hypothetical protein